MLGSLRRCVRLALLAATIGMVASNTAWAWGPDGHQIVARVAYGRLDPATKAAVDKIIAHGIDYAGCPAHSLDQFAVFPDCVRTKGKYAAIDNIHFDDIELCDQPPVPPASKPYCGNGICATEGIKRFAAVLRNSSASDYDRAEALAYVIHLVGDVHQPLHAENNGDRGGNNVSTRRDTGAVPPNPPHAIRAELHAFWDGGLVWSSVGNVDDGTTAVANRAQSNAATWGGGDPDTWVGESHKIAQHAYQALSIACGAGTTGPVRITKAYVDMFDGDVADQLGKASVRLSETLASALAGQ